MRLDGVPCGVLWESAEGISFQYEQAYTEREDARAISMNLPVQQEAFEWATLHPFFENLLPEGWLFDITVAKLKIQQDDAFGLLLAACQDCMGAVEIIAQDPTPRS